MSATLRFEEQAAALEHEIPEYAGRTALPRAQVGITLRYPVYSDLTPDQLDYYLYWRSTVGTPRFSKAAEGYTWLLICETINMADRTAASKRLNALCCSAAPDGSPLYPDLLKTAIEFSEAYGTPLPPYSDWMASQEACDYLSRAFARPVSDIPAAAAALLTGRAFRPQRNGEVPLGEVLRRYDGILTEKTGKCLRDTFLVPKKTAVLPFQGYVQQGKRTPIERIVWKPEGTKMDGLLRALLDLEEGKTADGGNIPCFEDLVSAFASFGRSAPRSGDVFSKPDGVLSRRLGTDPTSAGPSRLNDWTAASAPASNTLGDILTFSQMHSKSPSEFVTSGNVHPTFTGFTKEQFDYYLYWRDSFLEGRNLDTDNGYVNLFLTELINTDRNNVKDILMKLLKVYGNDNGSLIAVTIADYCILRDGSFSDYRTYADRYTVNRWAEEYLKGNDSFPPDGMILEMMRTGVLPRTFRHSDVPPEPVFRSVRRIFRELCAYKSPEDLFKTETISTRRGLFFGLGYLRGRPWVSVTYTELMGCPRFNRLVDGCARYIAGHTGHRNRWEPAKNTFVFQKFNCARILDDEITQWTSTYPATPLPTVVIDRSAVDKAQSELDAVTEMMAVAETEEAAAPAETSRASEAREDPWYAFAGSLTSDERRYLSVLLEMSEKNTIHIPERRTEDSINGKSLGTVGDTVIDNGRAVSEYENELRKMIIWYRTFRKEHSIH